MSNVIVVKLMTNEEIVGQCLKEYSEGDLRLADAMLIVNSPKGQFLDSYLMGGDNSILEIRSHAIVTHGPAVETLVELFTRTLIHNEESKTGQKKPH